MTMHRLLRAGLLASGLCVAIGAFAQTTAPVLDRETGLMWERDLDAGRQHVGPVSHYEGRGGLHQHPVRSQRSQ